MFCFFETIVGGKIKFHSSSKKTLNSLALFLSYIREHGSSVLSQLGMKPVFSRVSHAASRVGKEALKFQFTLTILSVSSLPTSTRICTVMWQRGPKSVQTKAMPSVRGEVVFNERLQIVATLYRDQSSKVFFFLRKKYLIQNCVLKRALSLFIFPSPSQQSQTHTTQHNTTQHKVTKNKLWRRL